MRTAALVALALWLPASIGIGLLIGRVLGRALRGASVPRGDTFHQAEPLCAGEPDVSPEIDLLFEELCVEGEAILMRELAERIDPGRRGDG